MTLEINHTVDNETYRHKINGHEFVLHCHHYLTLTAKLAEDFSDIGAPQVLIEVTEDSIRPLLDDYFTEHKITSPEERIAIGAEHYAFMGLGMMEISVTDKGGKVTLKHSHMDEGWLKKWGKNKTPVNQFTCGFVAAIFGAAYSKEKRGFGVKESKSIVMGAKESVLVVSATS